MQRELRDQIRKLLLESQEGLIDGRDRLRRGETLGPYPDRLTWTAAQIHAITGKRQYKIAGGRMEFMVESASHTGDRSHILRFAG